MDRFRIVQESPAPHREQILALWEEYLPGTPPGRFEWLNDGNPAGPAVWFFAREARTDELAGIITILPKDLLLGGRTARAGILGDFVIPGKYRAFGPHLALPRAALSRSGELRMDLVYTLPNPGSETVMKRVGFTQAGVLRSLVRPLQARHYLNRYLPALSWAPASRAADLLLDIVARDRYLPRRGVVEGAPATGPAIDELWRGARWIHSFTVGVHSSEYVNWRYLASPLCDYRVLTYRDRGDGSIRGFIVFAIEEGRMVIPDILAADRSVAAQLLKAVLGIGRRERCVSADIEVYETHPLRALLRSFGFVNARHDSPVYLFSSQGASLSSCWFFGGDRNL